MTLYVGNLQFSVTGEELAGIFGAYGEVVSAKVMIDRETGRSRGFAFVEMADSHSGEEAIKNADGANIKGRPLRVNEARPRN